MCTDNAERLLFGVPAARKSAVGFDAHQRPTVEANNRALHLQLHRQRVKKQNSRLLPCAQISIEARCSPRRTSGGSKDAHEYRGVIRDSENDAHCPTNQRGADWDRLGTNGPG